MWVAPQVMTGVILFLHEAIVCTIRLCVPLAYKIRYLWFVGVCGWLAQRYFAMRVTLSGSVYPRLLLP